MLMKLKWEMMLLRATLPDLLGIYDFARYVQYKIEFFWGGGCFLFFFLIKKLNGNHRAMHSRLISVKQHTNHITRHSSAVKYTNF